MRLMIAAAAFAAMACAAHADSLDCARSPIAPYPCLIGTAPAPAPVARAAPAVDEQDDITCNDPDCRAHRGETDASEEGMTTVYARATCADYLPNCQVDEGFWIRDMSGNHYISHLYQTADECRTANASLHMKDKRVWLVCVKKNVATWENAD